MFWRLNLNKTPEFRLCLPLWLLKIILLNSGLFLAPFLLPLFVFISCLLLSCFTPCPLLLSSHPFQLIALFSWLNSRSLWLVVVLTLLLNFSRTLPRVSPFLQFIVSIFLIVCAIFRASFFGLFPCLFTQNNSFLLTRRCWEVVDGNSVYPTSFCSRLWSVHPFSDFVFDIFYLSFWSSRLRITFSFSFWNQSFLSIYPPQD